MLHMCMYGVQVGCHFATAVMDGVRSKIRKKEVLEALLEETKREGVRDKSVG